MAKIAFVCVENAGRSQMAAAFARHLVGGRHEIVSGGTAPADRVNPVVVEAMAEVGIDMSSSTPSKMSSDDLLGSDYVITMGCGADGICPSTYRADTRDWSVQDPKGAAMETVRQIRDDIRRRVVLLLEEIEASGPT